MDPNPYVASVVAGRPADRQRKVNWALVIVLAWLGLGILVFGWGFLWMMLGLPIGD